MDNQEHSHNKCGPNGCGNQKHNMENHGHKCSCGSNCDCDCWCGSSCKCGENCTCGCKFGRDCTCGEKCGCFRRDACMVCGAHGSKKHKIIRILLLIALLAFTFWIGEKIGRFQGEFGWNNYHNQGSDCGMMSGYNYKHQNRYSAPMWQAGNYGDNCYQQSQPSYDLPQQNQYQRGMRIDLQ